MKKHLYILFIIVIFYACDSTDSGSGVKPTPKYNPDQLEQFIDNIVAAYPAITYKEAIGTSEEGRDIIAIIISNNPEDPNENEPRIRLTGSIHGDEHVTTALLCEFINYLSSNYNSSAQVQDLVDTRYIAIIPMLNPDGVAALSRYNTHNVDLNRNFGGSYDGQSIWTSNPIHGTAPFSEEESNSLKKFSTVNTVFHLSATYHSGEVIVNLPFDFASKTAGGAVPSEYTLVQYLAQKHYTLQGTFLENPDIMAGFYIDWIEDGTINGGDWYIVNGSLQDWSYLATGCIDLTIEISDKKYGHTESEYEAIYDYNINSMLAYLKAAEFGVSGQIVDTIGNPIEGASISISGSDLKTKSDNNGYYHKLLYGASGDIYTLQVGLDNYQTQTRDVMLDATNSVTSDENFTLISQ